MSGATRPRAGSGKKRVPSQSPYAGYLKWHHYAGLIFGVVTLTWTYSGLLSMGPFNWFSSPGITSQQREAFTGGPLRADLLTLDNLRAAAEELDRSFASGRPAGLVKELDVAQVRGEPYWLAYRAPSDEEAVQWMHGRTATARPASPAGASIHFGRSSRKRRVCPVR